MFGVQQFSIMTFAGQIKKWDIIMNEGWGMRDMNATLLASRCNILLASSSAVECWWRTPVNRKH